MVPTINEALRAEKALLHTAIKQAAPFVDQGGLGRVIYLAHQLQGIEDAHSLLINEDLGDSNQPQDIRLAGRLLKTCRHTFAVSSQPYHAEGVELASVAVHKLFELAMAPVDAVEA